MYSKTYSKIIDCYQTDIEIYSLDKKILALTRTSIFNQYAFSEMFLQKNGLNKIHNILST